MTTWEYDQDGRPLAMTADGQEVRFGYDPAGRETRRDLPGGLTLTQEWDQRGRLTQQELTGAAGPGPEGPGIFASGHVLQRRSYRYRPDGLVTGIDDLLAGARSIGLNRAGRVTTVAGQDWAERYAYDPAGNLTSASWPSPSPSAPVAALPAEARAPWLDAEAQGPREVTGSLVIRAGSIRYRHDRQGRVTQRQRSRISRKPDTWRYEWDADDRLVSATTPDGTTWWYVYDPFGRRIAKERLSAAGDVTERTDFTWHGPVLVEQAASPADEGPRNIVTWNYRRGTFTPITQAERTYFDDAPQDEIDRRFHAIITDLVGTPTELADPDGTIAGHQVQTLWGGTTWASGGARTPLRFPGQYEDQETGLHYNNHRYYDPVSASYLTPDPLGLAPAPNPHAYVFNPQVRADPLGLCPKDAAEDESSYVNLASEARTQHILSGHMPPGEPGNTLFPSDWSSAKIMNAVSEVATDPANLWVQQTGRLGAEFTRTGDPVRFAVEGTYDSLKLRVIVEPRGEGIITGFPVP